MRLFSLLPLLLLSTVNSQSAKILPVDPEDELLPTESVPKTTVETVYELVTKNIVHTVTESSANVSDGAVAPVETVVVAQAEPSETKAVVLSEVAEDDDAAHFVVTDISNPPASLSDNVTVFQPEPRVTVVMPVVAVLTPTESATVVVVLKDEIAESVEEFETTVATIVDSIVKNGQTEDVTVSEETSKQETITVTEPLPTVIIESATVTEPLPTVAIESATVTETLPTVVIESATVTETLPTVIIESATVTETLPTVVIESATVTETLPTVVIESATVTETLPTVIIESATVTETLPTVIIESATVTEPLPTVIIESATVTEPLPTVIIESATVTEPHPTVIIESATVTEPLPTVVIESTTVTEPLPTVIIESATVTEPLPTVVIESATVTEPLPTVVIEAATVSEPLPTVVIESATVTEQVPAVVVETAKPENTVVNVPGLIVMGSTTVAPANIENKTEVVPVRRTTIETVYETVTRTVIHTVPAPSTTVAPAKVPLCSCDVTSKCQAESKSQMETCMESCDDHLKEFGNKTDSYLECFQQNGEGVAEAERCLFEGLEDRCASGSETTYIESAPINKYTGFDFESKPHKNIKTNSFWNKGQREYSRFQKFFHCTKHCLHKKTHSCVTAYGCRMRMPKRDTYKKMMVECTKKNPKIAMSLLKTCQCLAYNKDVKSLIGTCVVVSNQYFVDNV